MHQNQFVCMQHNLTVNKLKQQVHSARVYVLIIPYNDFVVSQYVLIVTSNSDKISLLLPSLGSNFTALYATDTD